MNRGEVWWVRFGNTTGSEIRKSRPAVIVSNDVSNQIMSRVQIVPLTTSTDRLYPCEAYVTIKGKRSKALADQITTASKARLTSRAGKLSGAEMQAVERAIRVQLGLID